MISFTARDWSTRLGLVAAGLGIALVPGLAAQAMPYGVRWIPVRGSGLGRTAWAGTRLDPGPAASAMVDALGEELRSWAQPGSGQ